MSHQPHSPVTSGRSKHSFITVVVIVLAVGTLTTLAVSARSWLMPQTPANLLDSAPQDSSPIEATLVTIRPEGFEPAQITRSVSRFILSVENYSGLEEITLRLSPEGGSALHEVRLTREKLDWNQELDLQPGTYFLTEVNHPDWLCRITVATP